MANYDISYIFKVIDKFSPAIKEMQKSLEGLQSNLNKIEKKTLTTSERFRQLGNTMSSVGKSLTLGLTAPLVAAGTYAVKNAENFRQMQLSIQAFTGSAQQAAQVMKIVKAESMETPISVDALSNSARLLLSYGISVNDVGKRLHQMTIMSMGSGISVDELTKSFGRFQLQGFAQGRMLASLSRQGLPLLQTLREMGKSAGLSDQAMTKMLASRVGWKLIEQAMERITQKGSNFYNVAIEKSQTLSARLEELHNILRVMAGVFGEVIIDVLGLDTNLSGLQKRLETFSQEFPKWAEAHKTLLRIIVAFAGIAAILGPILWMLGNIFKAISLIVTITEPLLALIIAAELPFVVISALVATLAIELMVLYKRSALFREIVQIIYDLFKGLLNVIISIIAPIKWIIKAIEWIASRHNAQLNIQTNADQVKQQMAGLGMVGGVGGISFAPLTHNIQSTLDINVSAAQGTKVKSIAAKGDSKFNLGHNMVFAR